jgi:hypothetical protein
MTDDEQQQVKEFLEKKSEGDEPRFTCLVYGRIETCASDCEKRRGDNKIFYGKTKTPAAHFIQCVDCWVWKNLPEQKKSRRGKSTSNLFSPKRRKYEK